MRPLLENGQLVHHEIGYRVIWPDGTVHWMAARGHANYDADGKPISSMGVIFDSFAIANELKKPCTRVKNGCKWHCKMRRLLCLTKIANQSTPGFIILFCMICMRCLASTIAALLISLTSLIANKPNSNANACLPVNATISK